MDYESDESKIGRDDLVRIYLTQAFHRLLLTRQDEVAVARRAQETRCQFRRAVLLCPRAQRQVLDILQKAQSGELAFERVVETYITAELQSDQIRGRLLHNSHRVAVSFNVPFDMQIHARASESPHFTMPARDQN